MKTSLIILLCSALLLEGCYSYFVLNEEERARRGSLEGDDVLIVLKDGSEIQSRQGLHVEIFEPSEFILGVGSQWRSSAPGGSLTATSDAGRIPKSQLDSSKLVRSASYGTELLFQCWLKDGSVITFHHGDFLTITQDSGIGVWVIGTMNRSPFTGKILPGSVHHIGVPKISAIATIVSSIGVGLVIAALLGLERWSGGFRK